MSPEGIIVSIVIAFIIGSLYFNYIGPGLTFVIGIATLGIAKILTPNEILSGFANEQIAVIVMLLILGDVIKKSGVIDDIFIRAFVGVPMIIIGILYLLLFSNKLLPLRKDFIEALSDNAREYIAEVRVSAKAHYVGKTIEEAEFRNLQGLFLIEIIRGDEVIKPVTPRIRIL